MGESRTKMTRLHGNWGEFFDASESMRLIEGKGDERHNKRVKVLIDGWCSWEPPDALAIQFCSSSNKYWIYGSPGWRLWKAMWYDAPHYSDEYKQRINGLYIAQCEPLRFDALQEVVSKFSEVLKCKPLASHLFCLFSDVIQGVSEANDGTTELDINKTLKKLTVSRCKELLAFELHCEQSLDEFDEYYFVDPVCQSVGTQRSVTLHSKL